MPKVQVHKSNQRKKKPKVSMILLDWGVRDWFFALDWLNRQNVPRDEYELIWVELFDRVVPEVVEKVDVLLTCHQEGKYHKHKGYNEGFLHSRGDLVVVCDSDVVFPKNFISSLLKSFEFEGEDEEGKRLPKEQVLMHYEYRTSSLYPGKLDEYYELKKFDWMPLWPNVGACVTFRRKDVLGFGAFDEHESLRGYLCGPYELAWRLVNAGIPEYWHDPSVALWHFNHPQPFGSGKSFSIRRWLKEISYPHIDGHALTAVDAFSSGRLLPLLENPEVFELRMKGRRIGTPFEEQYSRLTGPEGFSKASVLKLRFKLGIHFLRCFMPLARVRYWFFRCLRPFKAAAKWVFDEVVLDLVKKFYTKTRGPEIGEERVKRVKMMGKGWRYRYRNRKQEVVEMGERKKEYELKLVRSYENFDVYLDAAKEFLASGARRFHLRGGGAMAGQFSEELRRLCADSEFVVSRRDVDDHTRDFAKILDSDGAVEDSDAVILFNQTQQTKESIPKILNQYLDAPHTRILAPAPPGVHYNDAPLFLISIPKSGTHLLYELAGAFGYGAGVECPREPLGGNWYCVEFSNSHTSARDFFIDTVRRREFGNRDYPFMRSPAVFIYRNPLDILVSEAHYYHREGKAAFSGYLKNKSFEERLLTLIDDPWLLGSIRDRMGAFVPWFEFDNVAPISFEEIVGSKGGGSDELQEKLIWSLQLKLFVPGKPREFGDKLFNEESATFFSGQIGSHREQFTDAALKKFESLSQDFMEKFGYAKGQTLSSRIEEFRKRPLRVSKVEFEDMPIPVRFDYQGFNIVKFNKQYFALPSYFSDDLRKEDVRANLTPFDRFSDVESFVLKRAVGEKTKTERPELTH